MVIAPAFSTAFLAPKAYRETTINARPPPTTRPSIRPMNGLLALSEHPGGVMAVTTLGTVLSRISGATSLCFGHYLPSVGNRPGHHSSTMRNSTCL